MNILHKIYENKKIEIEKRETIVSFNELLLKVKQEAHKNDRFSDEQKFIDIFDSEKIKLIAEIKKSSPSQGIIRNDINVSEVAKIYEANGAAAISVLTDKEFFNGDLQHLNEVRSVTTLPILQKDFVFTKYQILEAKIHRASAVLLIVSLFIQEFGFLNAAKMIEELLDFAYSLNLDVLVETHSVEEIKIANDLNAKIVGINVRNLQDMTIDLRRFENLVKHVAKDKIIIAESGISSREDVKYVENFGANGILVGTKIMQSENISAKVRELSQ